MASKNFSGTLIEPTGELANNDKIMFAQVTTTGEVIAGSVSIVKIGDDGTYDFDLQYGTISISTYNESSRRWIHQGTVTINSDTLVNTLPGLLNAFTPTTPAIVQQLEQILADGQQIIVDAQAQADSASSSALAAEGFKDLAEQAATVSANSANQSALNAVENGNVIKAILIAQGLSGEYGYFADGFTINDQLDAGIDASFQFWKYVGAETLPYDVPQGADPSAGGWELVSLSDHRNLINRNAANSHPASAISTGDGRSVQQRLNDLPAEVDAAGTAAALIDAHNHDASAHPELSAFITSEADRAEVAADVATSSGNIYADTTDGLAATVDGDYFSVVSSDDEGYLDLYKNESGSAVFKKTYPNANAVTNSKASYFNDISKNILGNVKFSEVEGAELRFLKCLEGITIRGIDVPLRPVFIVSGGVLDTFRLVDSAGSVFITLKSATTAAVSESNGHYVLSSSAPVNGKMVYVTARVNVNNSPDFTYSYDAGQSKVEFVEFIEPTFEGKSDPVFVDDVISSNSILSVKRDVSNKALLTNTMFLKFHVSEPVILGSVVVNIENVPSAQPAWVQCAIYAQGDGSSNQHFIAESGQQQIDSLGKMRLPLENVVLKQGTYSIGFKTNATNSLSTCDGVNSYRAFDTGYTIQPTNINLNPATGSRYGLFPAFDLYSFSESIVPKKPAEWSVLYEPEYAFLGQYEDKSTNIYLRNEGFSGSKTIRFYISTDGGLNKIALHNDNIDETLYNSLGDALNCVTYFDGSDQIIFYTTTIGNTVKAVISGGTITITDITPPDKSTSLSEFVVSSYAPLVLWKGFLFWGEYQDPNRPRIHKMDIDTGTWYTSIEKPTSGASGARHVHFIYKSPVDPNVLWAIWGDASNGAGQGLNKLTFTGSKLLTTADNWVQFTAGAKDALGTTLPYPTSMIEIYEGLGGVLGSQESVIISSGDQPPTHLLSNKTAGLNEGEYMMQPLNFKQESAPDTETCHWLTIDDKKTIYYMTLESKPWLSIYASPYPYTHTYRISKFWQQAAAGNIGFLNGYIQTRFYRFPAVEFVNKIDLTDVSKVPYVSNADSGNIVDKFNELLQNLQGANVLQYSRERGNDKNQSFWAGDDGKFENWN